MGIDGRVFIEPLTGVGKYAIEICKILNSLLPNTEFIIYSPAQIRKPVDSVRWTVKCDPWVFSSKMKPVLWLKTRCGLMAWNDKLDVFWGPGALMPVLRSRVKRITTLCDLNHLIVPETMSTGNRIAHLLFLKRDCLLADVLIVCSKGTGDRFQIMFKKNKLTTVIYPPIPDGFRRVSSDKVMECLRVLDITPPYFLCVATMEPRKNLDKVLDAFERLAERDELCRYSLVLAGSSGWKSQYIREKIKKLPVGLVRAVGYVPDDLLPALYTGAHAFLFPSTYEGFGIPVREAIHCGTDVICSDIPELREASYGRAQFIRPSTEGLYHAIKRSIDQGYAI